MVCKHFFQKKLYNPKDINTNQAYHVIILNYIRRYYNKIMKRRALKAAFPRTIPIMTGFIFLGMAYGIYMNASGFSFIYPFFMSMLIFGGSLEFVCVEMLLSPFAPVQVLIMAVMIQARHLFYGLSMLDKFKGLGWKKYYLIFGMCDENQFCHDSYVRCNFPGSVDERKNPCFFYDWNPGFACMSDSLRSGFLYDSDNDTDCTSTDTTSKVAVTMRQN